MHTTRQIESCHDPYRTHTTCKTSHFPSTTHTRPHRALHHLTFMPPLPSSLPRFPPSQVPFCRVLRGLKATHRARRTYTYFHTRPEGD